MLFFARRERTAQCASCDALAQLCLLNVTLFQWQLPFIITGCLSFNTAQPVLPASSWGAGLQPSEVSEVPMALSHTAGAQILPSLLPPLKHKHPQLLVSSRKRFWHLVPRSTTMDLHFSSSLVIFFNFFHRTVRADGSVFFRHGLCVDTPPWKHFESEFQQMNSTGLCMVEKKNQ